jgi:penicillin amidase
LLYADVNGNIGYYVSGRVPLRANGFGQVPQPGWTGEHEWVGNIPFEEMPHAFNPAQGFIVSANNRIIGEDYPYYLGRSWRNGFRARRIEEVITSRSKVSVEDCQQLQMDLLSIPGLELLRRIANLEPQNRDARLCLNLLQEWDGWLGPESVGGCVFQVLIDRLARAILKPKLGSDLSEQLLGLGKDPILYPVNELYGQWPATLLKLLDDPDCTWLPTGSEREQLLEECLAETAAELRRLLGTDTKGWQWGRFHQIRFDHTFAPQPPFEQIFCLGPWPIGGDADTVNQNSVIRDNPGDNIAPSYRQVIDLGNRDVALAIHAPGQSGQFASPHYADLLQPWLDGDYYQMEGYKSESGVSESRKIILKPAIRTD